MAAHPSKHSPSDAETEAPLIRWERHVRWLAPASVGILILATLFLWFQSRKTDIRTEVYQAYVSAGSPGELENVALAYPEQPEAPRARLQASALRYDEGDYESARVGYLAFLEQYPDHKLAGAARWGLLLSEEALGDLDVALEGYRAFGEEDLLYPQALLARARVLEKQNKLQEAKDLYLQVQKDFPETVWDAQAREFVKLVDIQLRKAE